MDASKLNTYSDVFALNEDTLRTLLSIDDQTVQIWAAWALGFKMSDASCPSEVRTLLDAEPTPGIRQNLLVFLAGSGDLELLETYARTDPNADVRAAACNLVARVAENTQEKNILLEELLISDESSDVRNTILSITLRDSRLISLESLRHVILNEEANLQKIVLEIVSLQRNSFGSSETLVDEVYEWAKHIHSDVYEPYCSLTFDLAGGEQVLKLSQGRLEQWSTPVKLLIKKGFRTKWFNLEQLAKNIESTGIPLLLDLLNDDLNQETAVWLMDIMVLSLAKHHEEYDYGIPQICSIALPRLYAILCSLVAPCKTEYAKPILKLIQSELLAAQYPDPDDTWELTDIAYVIEYYEDFSTRLSAWI